MNELPDAGGAGLERALEALEAEALALLEVVSSVARVAKRAKAAAETGTVRDIPQALDGAAQLANAAAVAAERLKAAWRFDVEDWFASGEYKRELLASTAEAGVSAFELDRLAIRRSSSTRRRTAGSAHRSSSPGSASFSKGSRSSSRRRSSRRSPTLMTS
jgi:hypothetical protein